jgi:hypothetical protein
LRSQSVGVLALPVVEVVDDGADGEAEELVDATHPVGVARGEVVVDGDDVDAAARQGVEGRGQCGDERLALARPHLGDAPLVQRDAADELHVEVAHPRRAHRGLAREGEDLGQDAVERLLRATLALLDGLLALGGGVAHLADDLLAQLHDAGAHLVVGELLHRRLEVVDLLDEGQQRLKVALVAAAENFGQKFIYHDSSPVRGRGGRPAPCPVAVARGGGKSSPCKTGRRDSMPMFDCM